MFQRLDVQLRAGVVEVELWAAAVVRARNNFKVTRLEQVGAQRPVAKAGGLFTTSVRLAKQISCRHQAIKHINNSNMLYLHHHFFETKKTYVVLIY